MTRFVHSTLVTAFALLCLPACDGASSDDDADSGDTGGSESLDQASIQAKLDAFPSGFTKINDATTQTQAHTAAQTVDVWVEDAWVATFLTVDPDASGSAPSFDMGATIVKEQFNADGARDSMTVMVKAEAGFNADVGDWWWGFTDAEAQLQGTGIIDACVGCHQVRPDDDFLYGVPLDNRL